MYEIREHSFNRLDDMNKRLKTTAFSIQPSTKKGKKIDVLIRGRVVASIGDINSMDFPQYLEKDGMEIAVKRREAYYNRFSRLPNVKDDKVTNMFFSRWFLW
jgi:hypothetical protein